MPVEIETNALKAISETPDELRVGNYIVLYGGRDLEGIATDLVNRDGSKGMFFSPRTKLESNYTQTGRLYVDWEHGNEKSYDPEAPGEDDILGYVDWSTAKSDPKGLWVDRVLYRRISYMKYLETLIKAGLIGTSSESVMGKSVIADNGEILKWPLKRDTLTVTPMEPRMMTENTVVALKALSVEFPALNSVIPLKSISVNDPIPTELAEDAPAPQADGGADHNLEKTETKNMELTQEQLETIIAEAGKSGADAALKSLPTINSAGVQVTRDEADMPFASMAAQLNAVKEATLSQGRVLAPRLKALNIKQLGANELVGSEGGFLLEPSFVAGLLTPLHETGPFSSRAAKLAIGPNANGVTVRAVDETSRATGSRWGGIRGYRLAEAGTKTASDPSFRLMELRLKKYAVLCYATEELLQDTTALGGIMQQGFSEEIDFMINEDIFLGLGANGPLGIMNSPALVTVAKEGGQLADTIVIENIFNMWARLHPRSKPNSVWFINTDVTPQLYSLGLTVGTGGMPMFMAPGSLPNSPSGSLLGRPVVETEFNDTLGDLGDILLADMSQYALIDKDAQMASSIHVQFLTDQVAFRMVYRCDGAPKWNAPLTPYQGTNTLSPFVTLAERA